MMMMEVTTQNHSTSSLPLRKVAQPPRIMKCMPTGQAGIHDLELKVDTGSSGNTLSVRIARQMYGELWQSKVEPAPNPS